MSGCGNMSFMEGGTLKSVSILQSSILSSRISSSNFDSMTIESIAEIQKSATKTIVDAIASLSPEELTGLATALFSAIKTSTKVNPVETEANELPTTVLGSREKLLGKPDHWVVMADGVSVPAYKG